MALGEPRREEAVVPAPRDVLELLLLHLDFHLQHLGHVRRRLLRVLGDERRVPRRLRHLHPPVVRQYGRQRTEHQDDAPHVVGLRHGGRSGIDLVRWGRERGLEPRGHGERDNAAGEDAEPLHGEDGGDERAAGLLVGVLGHDGGAQRVVTADAEAEPEAEEAERGHDARRRVREGEP
ncbi:Os03g0150550 [Oryza sativa Japonica Group]|uniref:Os03g0150550 protein n=1 Tax=Oryza sativa subsp. japonica TaxID=39947 RepID=A0A0P0VT33_ORYSJ|nr:hypothetical protein EE612_015336 [Oryza sativa]BAS82316.1 Os03g0150550 [Oryza sativa Japonica Group]